MKSSSPRKMASRIHIGSGLGAIAARGIVFGVPTLEGPRGPLLEERAHTEADARAQLLISLLEHHLLPSLGGRS